MIILITISCQDLDLIFLCTDRAELPEAPHWIPQGWAMQECLLQYPAGKILLSRRFCSAAIQVQDCVVGGHLAACVSACREVVVPIFQSNIALLPAKTMWAQYYIKNYSTDWFCNIFLPEGDGPALLGQHFLMNLTIKTFSVRYLIWNESRT